MSVSNNAFREDVIIGVKNMDEMFELVGIKMLDVEHIQNVVLSDIVVGDIDLSFEEIIECGMKLVDEEFAKTLPTFDNPILNDFIVKLNDYYKK